MDANRRTAYYTLLDVESKKSYSNIALNHHIITGKPDSPAFVRELVYGVLENKIYLDYMIGHFVKTPVAKMKTSDITVLRMGFYQLKYMNSVPEYAAVNESVSLAKRFCKGREGFVNGVLRSFIREGKEVALPDREKDLVNFFSIKYSYEPWIVELWLDQYAVDFVEELLAAGNLTPDLVIRVNTLKTSRQDLRRRVASKGFEVKDGYLCKEALHVTGGNLLSGPLYKNGFFSVQDESSMLAVNILDPKPGELIMDVCAAPGGKSLAIAEKMENMGEITSWDIYKRKVAVIDKEAERLGIKIITTKTWDATRVDSSMIEKADRVIVDAPCSGLGVVRRKPEIKYKKQSREISELPKKQLAILSASSKYVKPGGVLLYCTCTISTLENQKVVGEFLKKNPSFQKESALQLLPNINNTDGFFICKMRKEDKLIND
ncbi:16S rRNA (cytosine(967)-C(5))-methyltransferase RsmB [Sinanaerobacter chloroacetimidivorans]|uniref:16S rRNA (cytosine(967)-C(5))-methyltransferase n=1 Tax=Sinanaerobacter chloroacetimidivorans TaxID=2818044 RepID=A0A8J8B3X5_9FIRM|nr:16S rRNA (cytosine(967)-C(5))-methyltransferase RsmB [Sinanaerobacter chloroacetimidivorans]MBR0600221.1 16S rRNA (cytosine(967)-C(5))-methyltransferase RsmB [Sinanaerobacter chloroacetimidivorans]